jgi:hypothetical protein
MPSAKQIAWRKKFAKMAKAGKFKKSTETKSSSKTYEQRFAEWQKKRPKKEKIAMRKYEEGEKRFNLKTMRTYRKYHGDSKPANPDYVYMLNEKGELRGVKKSDIKKYKLGKRKYGK